MKFAIAMTETRSRRMLLGANLRRHAIEDPSGEDMRPSEFNISYILELLRHACGQAVASRASDLDDRVSKPHS